MRKRTIAVRIFSLQSNGLGVTNTVAAFNKELSRTRVGFGIIVHNHHGGVGVGDRSTGIELSVGQLKRVRTIFTVLVIIPCRDFNNGIGFIGSKLD